MPNVLRSGKWSHYFPQCVNCGTTDIPHKADGFCNRCYLWAYRQARRMGYATVRSKGGAVKRMKKTGKKRRKTTGSTGGGRN